jgi:hypothetical protein
MRDDNLFLKSSSRSSLSQIALSGYEWQISGQTGHVKLHQIHYERIKIDRIPAKLSSHSQQTPECFRLQEEVQI